MEGVKRKSFQGVGNIVRFNWHFYVIALVLVVCFLLLKDLLPYYFQNAATVLVGLAVLGTFVSLAVSYYVYDYTGLYTLQWLDDLDVKATNSIVNINAGFDETSALLQAKYPTALLTVLDFYDPARHTEVSIERARKAYPAYPCTISVSTGDIPLQPNTIQYAFLILAAHEIRDDEERRIFLEQLRDSLSAGGKIIVVEHLRDVNNFLAYNFGFFHFLAHSTWINNFSKAGLSIDSETKLTPFISCFVLSKNGAAA